MKHFFLFLVLLVLLISIPFPLDAQENEVTLEEVVVTGTRDVQEIRKIPANVSVITKEEIEKSNAQFTINLLRDEVGVVIRDFNGTGKSAFVDIRGFGETGPLNTLVLVDGRRVNEIDLSGVDWTQIPIDQLERIEIVRGPGSVLYGDNAVGGVINIITKKPEKPFSANVEGVIGSYNYHKESGSIGGKWGPLSAILNAGYNGTEGYRENGFLRTKDVGGKLIYEVSHDVMLNFSGNFHRDDAGLPGALLESIYKSDRRAARYPRDKAETDDGYGSIGVKANVLNFGQIEADLSLRDREIANFFPSSSFKDKRNLSTWGFTPRYVLEKNLWNHSNKLTAGLDFYDSDSDILSKSTSTGSNRSEVKKRSTGLYFLDEFSILDNLISSFGYRYEWVTYDLYQRTPLLKDKIKDEEYALNVGLNYLFGKRSSIFLNFKQSFRFPVSDELIQYIYLPPTFEAQALINPAMKPQTGDHYEAGIRHAFTDRIEFNVTLFWIDLNDEIYLNPVTYTNENYQETRRQGIEAEAKVKPFEWLSLWGNYTYTRPLLRGGSFSGNDIPGVPRYKGSLGMDIDFGRGFLLYTTTNIVGPRYFISDWANQVDRLDEYYTIDAKLSYYWKGVRAFLGVNNLTNRKFAEYGVLDFLGRPAYYPSPERNFFGGVSYTF